MEEDDTIWYECQICYILLHHKNLIENHIERRHPHLLRSNQVESEQNNSYFGGLDLQSSSAVDEKRPSLPTFSLQFDYIKTEQTEEDRDGNREFPTSPTDVLSLGSSLDMFEVDNSCSSNLDIDFTSLEKIDVKCDLDEFEINVGSTSSILTPTTGEVEPQEDRSVFWDEVKIPDAFVLVEDCLKINLPIVKKEGAKNDKCTCIVCYKMCSSKEALKRHRKTHKRVKNDSFAKQKHARSHLQLN